MSKELEKLRYIQGIEMLVPKTKQKPPNKKRFTPRECTVLNLVLMTEGAPADLRIKLLNQGSDEIQELGLYYIDKSNELKEYTKEQAEEVRKLLLGDKIL
jgi:hypothetical protein